jgi:hypothetical protein
VSIRQLISQVLMQASLPASLRESVTSTAVCRTGARNCCARDPTLSIHVLDDFGGANKKRYE